ncbi:hypothetical protein D3C77_532020 [compost metagenome]
MDVLALVLDLQGFAVVALALAHVAGHVDVRQKVHFDLDQAVTLAGLAAPALDVEGETPRAIAARTGFRHAGEQFTNGCEQPGVGRRVRARCTADRALVDVDHLVQVLQAVAAVVRRRLQRTGAIEGGRTEREQGVVDQR